MAYWIQKSTNHNMSNYRLFHCDYRSDIDKLPKFELEGEPQKNDTISHKPCSFGSQALVLEDSSTWELSKNKNEWKELKGGYSLSVLSESEYQGLDPKDEKTIYFRFEDTTE